MSEAVLTLKGVKKSYGSHAVLKGVDMTVNKGDIYGLIGRNGAGKTTLFKLILGLSSYQGGTISICGAKNDRENMINRRKIGFFVGSNFFPYMTGRANLNYYCKMKGISDKSEVDRVLEIVSLDDKAASKPVDDYSLGMKQRLGIAKALLGDPKVLIMDEPANGLDPQGIADIRHILTRLNEEHGATVIISSHILGELEHTAHRFGIVNDGVVVRELVSEDLQLHSNITSIDVADQDVEKAQAVLSQNGINIIKTKKAATSLEDFYFNLVGGEK